MSNPYQDLPSHAFWRTAVAEKGALGLERLWTPKFQIAPEDKIVTFGSCFAQHFSRALTERGYNWFDAEPAPPWLIGADAEAFNYGIFSVRTGNIYTPKMLRQWLELAFGKAKTGEVWQEAGRWYDPLRPVIEPEGFASEAELLAVRGATLAALRRAVTEAQVFVFTLGLTESWRNAKSGVEYALCPGTVPGAAYDGETHVFHNAGFAELQKDLDAAIKLLRTHNKNLRILLTVSPVPLIASASGEHVLTATSHSKALLRAVAGEVAAGAEDIDYFPSFEIITSPVFRGMFFAPNLRSVVPQGVATVMGHFFAEQERAFGPAEIAPKPAPKKPKKRKKSGPSAMAIKCEEEFLGAFAK